MEKQVYDRKKLVSTLTKSTHGKLEEYVEMGLLAGEHDPEMLAHFIAWNEVKGKVRDSKVAYPVIALRNVRKTDRDLAENAVAHLMKLSPRDLVRAYDFNKQLTSQGKMISGAHRMTLEEGIRQYLQVREDAMGWWIKTAIQHRHALKRLYRISHKKPSDTAQRVLFDRVYLPGEVFNQIAKLKEMTAREAAAVIMKHKLPFEVVVGAVNLKDKDIVLALIEGMTGNQLVTNTKMLTKLGVMNDPVLKAAYNQALYKSQDDKKLNVLKTETAIKALGVAGASVRTLSAEQSLENLQATAAQKLGNIEGSWLVIGDCSGSMTRSIELAKKIASFITERVKGKVWLVFCNTYPSPFEVTGKTYLQINAMTSRVTAGGGTSLGCGMDYIFQRKEEVDGVVIVSDGGENNWPYFPDTYKKYAAWLEREPTVYMFKTEGDYDRLSNQMPSMTVFDVTKGVDYYSLPNIVSTLRTNKYSLEDEIMETPLLKMADAFRKEN